MSLVVHTRFSSCHLSAVLILTLRLSSSIADTGEDDFFIKGIIKESQPDIKSELPDWLKTKPAALSPVFEKILRQGNNGGHSAITELAEKPIQGRWIFVSMSMPAHEMKAAAEEAARSKSILVFRGVEKGGDTGTVTRRLYTIVKDIKPIPAAVIDPTLFIRFNVQSVPSMIETNAAGETRSARGLPGFGWLSKQEAGDLGQRGPVFGIDEPDMIEEMQRRMKEFDWQKEKQRAIDNFWAHQNDSVTLPVAEKNSERRINTSIISTQDIFHPDGRLIIKKGQTINPQALMPMRHVYIVFDATNKRQVEIAKKIGDETLTQQKPVIYLFSKVNTNKGWKHYNETTALMNAPIYKLNKAIVDRFKIKALPSIVEGRGDSIVVKEIDARGLN